MEWEAQYGKLPFDQFALVCSDEWNYSLPISQDQTQWNILAKKWLALTLKGRKPYLEAGRALGRFAPGDPHLPSQDQIDRVLAPHQSLRERLVNPSLTSDVVIWLRTCYAPGLARAYDDLAYGVADGIVDDTQVLDNMALYNFGDKWDRILNRMPSLCDCAHYREVEDFPIDDTRNALPLVDDPKFTLHDAVEREVVMIYLLDRQGVEEKLVSVLWLDMHGECVWWYKLDPEHLLEFAGWMARGAGLMMLAQLEGSEEIWQKEILIDLIF